MIGETLRHGRSIFAIDRLFVLIVKPTLWARCGNCMAPIDEGAFLGGWKKVLTNRFSA